MHVGGDNNHRSLWQAGLLLLVLCMAPMLLAAHAHAADPELPDATQVVLRADGDFYPAVVAYANGVPISGQALARRVAILQQTPAEFGGPPPDPVAVALANLIDEAILLDAAPDVGVTVSEDEARAFAQAQRDLVLASGDQQVVELYAASARQLGVSVDVYPTQPQVIEVYRQALTLGKMRAYIRQSLLNGQQFGPDAYQQALDAFITSHTKEVRILIGQ